VGPAGQSRLAPADPVEREVLARLTPVPTTLSALAERSDRDLGELASALGRLVAAGHVRAGAGWWALA
jgi:predicted Rossmann fold nucleotide-binding protein DprA/Smf involved in DNA uptake